MLIVINLVFTYEDSATISFFLLLVLIGLLIYACVGFMKGSFSILKSRKQSFLLFVYSIITTSLVIVTLTLNYLLDEELGYTTTGEKLSVFANLGSVNEGKLNALIQEYRVQQYNHISFYYHPSTEHQVGEMIEIIAEITELEKQIFGRELKKDEPLQVIVLQSANDYKELIPLASDNEGGSYSPSNNRAIIYDIREVDSQSVSTFIHEYSHYLFNLATKQMNLADNDIPQWFEEGISDYMQSKLTNSLDIPGGVDSSIKFTQLHSSAEWKSASKLSDVYYAAKKAIYYIVGKHGGTEILNTILIDLQQSGSFEQSLLNVTGIEESSLHETIFSFSEKLHVAWQTWSNEGDFEHAHQLYIELLQLHPHESLAWHQYALMLEKQNKWEEALIARETVIKLQPYESTSYLYTSYLLTVMDSKRAVELAEITLELSENEEKGNVLFARKWLDEITTFHQLKTSGKIEEAYNFILQSEQLSYFPEIIEELDSQRQY